MAESALNNIASLLNNNDDASLTLVRSLFNKLQKGEDPIILPFQGKTFNFTRANVFSLLRNWAVQRFPGFDEQKFYRGDFSQLNQLLEAVKSVEEITAPSRLTRAKLEELSAEKEAWLKRLQPSENPLLKEVAWIQDPNIVDELYNLKLEKQIEILEKARKDILNQAIQFAPADWPETQKIEFAQEISQEVVEQTIIQQLAGQKINQAFIRATLENLTKESPVLSIGLNQEQIQSLSEKIGPSFISAEPDKPNPYLEELADSQKKILKAQAFITPTYEESRVKLKTALQKELGLSEKKAQAFAWRLEANLQQNPAPHSKKEDYPLVTSREVKKAIKASLKNTDYIRLGNQKKTADGFAQQLLPLAQTHQAHLVLAQHPLEWQGFNSQTIKLATRLTKKGVRPEGQVVTAQAIEHLSRGLTAEAVLKELTQLQSQGADSAKIAKLQSLYQQMKVIDPKRGVKVLPWRWRRRVRKAQRKAKLLEFLDKANPFGFQFWHKIMPTETQWLKTKVNQINKQIDLLKFKKFGFWQKYNPLSFRNRCLRQYKRQQRRLSLWRKTVAGVARLPGIRNNLPFRKKLREFLYKLPQNLKKFKLSSIPKAALRPIYGFTQRQLSKAFISMGKKLAGKAIGKSLQEAGKIIGDKAVKGAIGKGIVYLLGTLGLSVSGVGTILGIGAAIGTAATITWNVVKFAASKEGQEIVKKIVQPVLGLAAAGLHFALSFLMAHKFALAGALFGSFLGPTGMAGGGFLGYLADSQVVPFLQKAGAGLGLGNSAGAVSGTLGQILGAGTSTGAAAGSGFLGFLLAPTAAAPIAVVAVGLTSTINMLTTSSAFVSPAELGTSGPGITEYSQDSVLSVMKTASPTKASSNQQINYQLEISSQDGGLNNVVIDDNPDLNSLEIISVSPAPTDEAEMVWDINQMLSQGKINQNFSSPGATLTINYTTRVKENISLDNKIYNQVTVTAQNQEGETVTRKAYVIINSDCQDVVAKAAEIMDNLIMASNNQCKQINPGCVNWILENRWEGYLHGYNCPVSSDIRQQTDPLSTTGGCVVCNDLVTMSYLLTNHPHPQTTGWENTIQKWKQQNILLTENGKGDISKISSGDIVYFDVKRTAEDGSTYMDEVSHVGIVAGVSSTGIYTWEANTPKNGQRYYSYSEGSFLPLGGVVFVNAIGNTCQE
jgi:hypothetical protein